MVPLTLLIIGPASQIAANGIANGFNFLVKHVPVLAAALVGGVWQVFVIFGVHWGVRWYWQTLIFMEEIRFRHSRQWPLLHRWQQLLEFS